MKTRRFLTFSIVALSLVLSACAPAAPDARIKATATLDTMMKDTATPDTMMKATATPDAMMKATATPDAMMKDTATPDAMMKDTATSDTMMKDTATPDAMMKTPTWYGATLTDVTQGTTFTLNDFKGKVVLIETMAQWCPTCKRQQLEVKALREKLGMPAGLVTVALDIDPNEDAASLKAYAAKNGFDWIYAVTPAEVAREIGNLYSSQFLNPPSAPILVIDRTGAAHPLPFGVKSAADLSQMIEPYLQ